jgi:NAD(P)-dependent dehydrogenase (short-subunit alcohol dehydrogenase family)
MPDRWTAADIPDQHGRVAVVTGANSGLGLVTARELARAGARVVLACRSMEKGETAAARIGSAVPRADVQPAVLDLTALESVRAFAATAPDRLHLLVNNAGVMAAPRGLTTDGFESQFGTNHLGHFALTGLLLGNLLAAPAPRVVTVSSMLHRTGTINFDDLQGERKYNRWGAYGQSKLANLMFCFELQRRAVAADTALLSMAAHPGYAATNLQSAGTDRFYERWYMAIGNKLLAQSAHMGALPTLYAATVPDLPGGTYVGPGGRSEQRGHPKVVGAAGKAYDEQAWRRLWEVSEELTGVRYAFHRAAGGGVTGAAA